MRFLTLEQCKRHLVVEHDEDDELIISKATAAENAVENYLDAPLDDLTNCDGTLPYDIVEGILLFLGTLYGKREGFSSFNVTADASIVALLKPHKSYVGRR